MKLIFSTLKNQLEDKARWNEFVKSSPQGTIFTHTSFLDSYDIPYDLCVVKEDNKIVAGLAVLLQSDGSVVSSPLELGMYQQTFLFQQELFIGPVHSSVKKSLAIEDFFLNELWSKYGKISLSLHHSIRDGRGVDWFHYHKKDEGIFRSNTFYSGIISLSNYPSFSVYLDSIRRTRKQEYQSALKKGLVTELAPDIDTMLDLYLSTFERQGLQVNPQSFSLLKRIIENLLKENKGEILFCIEPETKRKVAATFFVHDQNTKYYLVAANHPESRSLNAGTFLVLENIRLAMEQQFRFVDLVGINSPNRGDFKTSFNAEPTPYLIANCP